MAQSGQHDSTDSSCLMCCHVHTHMFTHPTSPCMPHVHAAHIVAMQAEELMQQLHAAKVSEVQLSQQVALLTAQVAALEQAAAQVAALEQAAAAQQRLEVVGQKVGRRIPPRPPPPAPAPPNPPRAPTAHPLPPPSPHQPLTASTLLHCRARRRASRRRHLQSPAGTGSCRLCTMSRCPGCGACLGVPAGCWKERGRGRKGAEVLAAGAWHDCASAALAAPPPPLLARPSDTPAAPGMAWLSGCCLSPQ